MSLWHNKNPGVGGLARFDKLGTAHPYKNFYTLTFRKLFLCVLALPNHHGNVRGAAWVVSRAAKRHGVSSLGVSLGGKEIQEVPDGSPWAGAATGRFEDCRGPQ
jgi:hypothetical protein